MSFWSYRPYVPVAKRRAQAAKEVDRLKKKGRAILPVVLEGRKIAQSFWGKAWCDNLERYSDFENRLPRGRTYVRNGSVVDLQIARGGVRALVSGSDIYEVKIDIALAAPERWKAICRDCAGSIGSLVELLKGKLSKNVMERVCRENDGLFPAPREIKMSCTCPDWADMCKHVAATLYGAGARLDSGPELLFTLRGVDSAELIASAGADGALSEAAASSHRILADEDVAAMFGIEMAPPPPRAAPPKKKAGKRAKEKTPATSKQSSQGNADETLGSDKKPMKAPSTRKVVAKAGARSKAREPRPSAPTDVKKGKSAAPRKGAMRARKMETREPINLQTVASASIGKSRKNEQASGRTRAAKWIGAKKRKSRG
ncbi:hypothetical protein [Methylocystis sp.]|jgi:uncharacterized Zn finger protein|uniref:SWIM zinc finger family protein n=1 Tax=Methylocystis sp. TaxID=1911079 RepID=UPI0025F9E214|nr:hypothetical protein [Methylocystis sp.]